MKRKITCIILFFSMLIFGCSPKYEKGFKVSDNSEGFLNIESEVPETSSPKSRTIGNSYILIDLSNEEDGYLTLSYKGEKASSKLQIDCNDIVTYTYTLNKGEETVIPVSEGDGTYSFKLYENIGTGNEYATVYADSCNITTKNEYTPFLYPNTYVNYSKNSPLISETKTITKDCTSDLEAIFNIYNFVTENIEYDFDLAENIPTDYLPDPDETFSSKKGICLDYASLMCAMLRSSNIPAKLVVGYAGDCYHAWISVYTENEGFIDGIIRFDGKNFTFMDPTFAANTENSKDFKKFFGDGENYFVQYCY